MASSSVQLTRRTSHHYLAPVAQPISALFVQLRSTSRCAAAHPNTTPHRSKRIACLDFAGGFLLLRSQLPLLRLRLAQRVPRHRGRHRVRQRADRREEGERRRRRPGRKHRRIGRLRSATCRNTYGCNNCQCTAQHVATKTNTLQRKTMLQRQRDRSARCDPETVRRGRLDGCFKLCACGCDTTVQSGPTDPWALRHCTTQARGTTRAVRVLVCVCGLMRMCVCMFMRVGACARACARVQARACACTAAASVLHPRTCTRILLYTTPSAFHAPTRATRTYRHIVAHALRRSDVLMRLDLAEHAA